MVLDIFTAFESTATTAVFFFKFLNFYFILVVLCTPTIVLLLVLPTSPLKIPLPPTWKRRYQLCHAGCLVIVVAGLGGWKQTVPCHLPPHRWIIDTMHYYGLNLLMFCCTKTTNHWQRSTILCYWLQCETKCCWN